MALFASITFFFIKSRWFDLDKTSLRMTNVFPSKKRLLSGFFLFRCYLASGNSATENNWRVREGLWKFPMCGYKWEVVRFAKSAGPLVRNFPSVRFLDSTGLARISRRLNHFYISNVYQFSGVRCCDNPKWRFSRLSRQRSPGNPHVN